MSKYTIEIKTVTKTCLPGILILLKISSMNKKHAGANIHTLTACSLNDLPLSSSLSLKILKINTRSLKTVVSEPIKPKYLVNGTK